MTAEVLPDYDTLAKLVDEYNEYSNIKYNHGQEWLDKNYPKEERDTITKLDIRWKGLEGSLNLTDFVNLTELSCPGNKLTELDLTGLTQLKAIGCSRNYLTNIIYPLNANELIFLNIVNNNLPEQDCSVFSRFTNLENLYIGNGDNKEKIEQGIYNRFTGSLEPLQNLTKLKKLNINNTDIDSGLEYLPDSIKTLECSNEERPESKVSKISEQLVPYGDDEYSIQNWIKNKKDWEKNRFNNLEREKWIESGLKASEWSFAVYLRKKGCNPSETTKIEELRTEYCKAQKWLDEKYPKKSRTYTKEIYLNEPSLEGELDLEEFIYCGGSIGKKIIIGIEVYISTQIDELKFKNLPEGAKVIKLVNAQEWLDKNYPKNGVCQRETDDNHWGSKFGKKGWNNKGKTRAEIVKLDIGRENLEGELDLSDFINLEYLYCSCNKLNFFDLSNCSRITTLSCGSNLLTNIILPANPTNLRTLDLSNNNFPEQDLSFLVPYTSLESLDLGNYTQCQEKIEQGIYNKFAGSLDHLSGMKNLESLDISYTDLNEVDVTKLPNSLRSIGYSTEARPNCKLTAIILQLDGLIYKKYWKTQGFDEEQIKEWMQAGIEPKDYNFVGWLRYGKKVTPEWVLNNKTKKSYQKLRKKCNEFGSCLQCQQPNTSHGWCQPCHDQEWREDIKNLTGQELVEKFIEKQPSYKWNNGEREELKWIPYQEFTDISDKPIGEGGFSKIYKATYKAKKEVVALKNLSNSKNITLEFLTEIANNKLIDDYSLIVTCYGISQDPKTENYVVVMRYIPNGSLRNHLRVKKINFKERLDMLHGIILGLNAVHGGGLVHRDFHAGNILGSCITDLGLSKQADEVGDGKIYGVLPYVAPEVLQRGKYTQNSDVYSFGIVAYELFASSFPYIDSNLDDNSLTLDICEKRLRPNLDQIKIPQLLKDLIKKCWDNDPEKRPDADKIYRTLNRYSFKKDAEFNHQVKELEEEYNHFSQTTSYQMPPIKTTHSKLINTEEIARLFQQNSNEQALDLEIKNIEKKINQPLTDELKKLVKEFLEIKKQSLKNGEDRQVKKEAGKLKKQLLEEKVLSEEKINKIILYCERFVDLERQLEQEKLQANVEISTNK